MTPIRTYAQLVRLPNVFTALADICLGGLAAWSLAGWDFWSAWAFACLLLASACLYSAGMVWNDYFDIEQDRKERPFRPLPSGRVSPREALQIGSGLLAAGLVLAALAGWRSGGWTALPVVLAALLAAAILLYDGWLKRTWVGPIGMGLCRFLNVLLGLTISTALAPGCKLHLATVVGLYIVGVTWFARTEARMSHKSALEGAAVVMLAALALALPVPLWFPADTSSPLFPYLLVGLGFLVGVPVWSAIARPAPGPVQAAVKRSIMGLVVLDATLATALAGTGGLVILVLLVPALYLGRWIYST
jgi:4-hydroxybenzoate polyprenyltransferase